MILHPAPLILALLVTASSLSGIELFLKNGDRLQGELIVESDDHFTIQHPILGEIEIAKSDLAELPPPEQLSPPAEPAESAVPEGDNLAQQQEAKPEIQESEPDKKPVPVIGTIPRYLWGSPNDFVKALQRINARVGFSFSDKMSRRDQTDVRFFLNSKWKNGKSEYRLDTDYRFRETDGDTSDNRYTGNFRFRREQRRDYFIQATTFYRRDPIRKINNWIEQGVGAGWNKKISSSFEYSVGVEGSVKFEDFENGDSSLGGTEFTTAFFQDSVLQIGKNYQLVQEAESYIAPDNSENWGYKFDLKLDGKITTGFTMRLGYEYSFDNIVPSRVPQEESRFSSSLLYTF